MSDYGQNKKNRCCIITCYIGKLPDWMQQWLYSCGNNKEFDFLVVTDDKEQYSVPTNVTFLYSDLQKLKVRFQDILRFPISLPNAYKLCDYKVLYGLAFSQELNGYEFWGHCDIDMLFGDLSKFITKDILDKYDRIGTYGALILYRNNDKINNLYKLKGGAYSYKTVFSHKYNYGFDETFGMNLICKKNGIAWCNWGHEYVLDRDYTTELLIAERDNKEIQGVYWHDGKIMFIQLYEDSIHHEECMYFHFSKTHYNMGNLYDDILFENVSCKEMEDTKMYNYLTTQKKSNYNLKTSSKWERLLRRNFRQKCIRIRQEIVRRYVDWKY